MPEHRFTSRARRALMFARREAASEGREQINAEHILLGLSQVGEGTGYTLLQRCGATTEALRRRLPHLDAAPSITSGAEGFTGDARRVLESAHREGRMEGCQFIGSEHLLLGIIDGRTTRAARLLADLGLDLMRYRQYLDDARQDAHATSAPGWAQATGGASPLGQERETLADAAAVLPEAPPAAPRPEPAAASPGDVLEEILAHNEQFVAQHPEVPPASHLPTRRLAILTCMDCRLTDFWEQALGLQRGEAVVVRSAGGGFADNDSPLRSLAVAVYALDVDTIIVMGHTGCGMSQISVGEIVGKMSDRGVSRDRIPSSDARAWLGAFTDVADHVLDTVDAIRDSGLFPDDVAIHPLLIDSDTGRLSVPTR